MNQEQIQDQEQEKMINKIQDELVLHPENTTWDKVEKILNIKDSRLVCHKNLIKQVFMKSHNESTEHDLLDAFMKLPTWSPDMNDLSICLWMVSGDKEYLYYMAKRMQETVLSHMSGEWALTSLYQQYPTKAPSLNELQAHSSTSSTGRTGSTCTIC